MRLKTGMRLIIFDIDGTLTETMKVDAECFVSSFAEVFGVTGINTDWTKYRHSTDSGIFEEIFLSRFGGPPTMNEITRFRRHFIGLLGAASAGSPFAAVAGAGEMLAGLACNDGCKVALATGAWSDSARVKMASAGMCFDDYPAASGDDAHDRETIIKLSMERACERFGSRISRAVYIGDGIWDARACRALGLPFVGIGAGGAGETLRAEGAAGVLADFSDNVRFLEVLEGVWKTWA
jgi:phosphoglycolate phosphatase-like HAD superfamily hydrolase